MANIGKLEKEIQNHDQIVNHTIVSLRNLNSYFHRNAVNKNTVTSPALNTLSQIN